MEDIASVCFALLPILPHSFVLALGGAEAEAAFGVGFSSVAFSRRRGREGREDRGGQAFLEPTTVYATHRRRKRRT